MTFWLHRFRKLDVRQKSHRKMLIDTFINAIFLYDDKMVITFNYKEGTTTITFDDLKTALADQKTGSDLDCSTAPKRKTRLTSCLSFWVPQAKGLLHPSVFECSGKVNSPCAKVFACAKTLVRRKSAAGQKAGCVILLQQSCQYQISILTAPSKKGDTTHGRVSLFSSVIRDSFFSETCAVTRFPLGRFPW